MNLSLPRQVMLDRNLVFHEDWAEIGHEDVELGYRWSKAGYRTIYVPAARGEHYHPHDLESSCRLQASIGRGLRDLEALVPEPGLHERYGVLTSQVPFRRPGADGGSARPVQLRDRTTVGARPAHAASAGAGCRSGATGS